MAGTKKKQTKKGLSDAQLIAKYETGKPIDLEEILKKGLKDLWGDLKPPNGKN